MERLRIVSSSTEAVMCAVRVAREFTHRNKIVKFEGCYHGYSDGLLIKSGSGMLTHSVVDGAGVISSCNENTLIARYNDIYSVEELFQKYGNEIACIIVEPCAANMGVISSVSGFLKSLKEITEQYNSLLIFDESITGFRLSIGGAQEVYKVKPDLTVLGKIVGGGMPLAVYGGRKDIMECLVPLGSVYQAGTFSGNPVAIAAGAATIKIIENTPDFYEQLEEKSVKLARAMRSNGLNVNRIGSIMSVFFTNKYVFSYATAMSSNSEKYALYYSYLLENGIYVAPSQYEAMFVSIAHTDEDIEKTCKIVSELV
jgi:glutamate-1-semialdehyde 2,1-aminomutase